MRDTSGSLANVLQKEVGGGVDRIVYQGGVTRFAERVAKAQRYFLTPTAVEAMMHLCRTKPSSLSKAIKFARMPFPEIWLEWTPIVDEKEDDEFAPVKQGCLIQQYDDTHFALFGCWLASPEDSIMMAREVGASLDMYDSRYGGRLMLSGAMVVASPDGKAGRIAEMESVCFKIQSHVDIKFYGSGEQEAADEMFAGFQMTFNPYAAAMFREASKIRNFHELIESAVRDMATEAPKMLSMLCLLTAKNCMNQEPVDNSKWNKARAKQGQRPILDHTIVDMSLSRSSQRSASKGSLTEEERRRHIVAGHWKVRKTGIYFWHPHWRGSGPEIGRQGTTVR